MILGIYGAGGLGKGVCDLATRHHGSRWSDIIFVDDVCDEAEVHGRRVMSFADFTSSYSANEAEFVVAQGEPANKELLFQKVREAGYSCATLVHPDAEISFDTTLGEGVIIFCGCYISAESVIEDNVCIMPHVGIGHNVRVGRGTQISMGCNVGGFTTIGSACYLGITASLRDRITIGNDAVISQGACVLRDVAESSVVMGNPARPIAKNQNRRVWDQPTR